MISVRMVLVRGRYFFGKKNKVTKYPPEGKTLLLLIPLQAANDSSRHAIR